MKTKNLVKSLIVIALVMPFTINAQIKPQVRGGIVASTHSEIGDLAGNNHMTLSYVLGGSLIIPISKTLSFYK